MSLAGENSGHLIIKEINPTGDGIVASLMILKILSESGRKLSELADEIELYPQIQAKVKVMEKTPIEEIPGLCELIKSQEALLEGGRMLVRYSGTEPVMRVMAEGPDSTKVHVHAEVQAARKKMIPTKLMKPMPIQRTIRTLPMSPTRTKRMILTLRKP